MKALLVEDNAEILFLMEYLLNKNGYEVRTASNGVEALEILGTEVFDLLVTDFNMPFMNGLELIENILIKNIKIEQIIVLSAITHNEPLLDRIIRSNTNIKFVSKNTPFNELSNILKSGFMANMKE